MSALEIFQITLHQTVWHPLSYKYLPSYSNQQPISWGQEIDVKPDINLVECKSLLTKTGGFLHSYTHTINPYAGCAFGENGCGIYCYVAESPIGRFGRGPWGSWVNAKINAAEKLEKELRSTKNPGNIRAFMSSATDPYQPAEAKLGITRQILEILRQRPIGLLALQTRSPLVERDYSLLAEMPFAWLSMTVETDDDAVRKTLTPICPGINRRIQAMQRARALGIKVQAAVSPVLPHNPDRFTELLAQSADRVVIDTFVAGDGSQGKRTARRPLPQRYETAGLGDWRDESPGYRLYDLLIGRMGRANVVWSSEGFNSL